jgi:hypothetical protein
MKFIKKYIVYIVAALSALVALAIYTGSAKAGSITTTILDSVVIAPQKSDPWTGPLIGAGAGVLHSTQKIRTPTVTDLPPGDYDLPPELVGNPDLNTLPSCRGFSRDCASRRNGAGDITQTWLTDGMALQTGTHTTKRSRTDAAGTAYLGYRHNFYPVVIGAVGSATYNFGNDAWLFNAEAQAGVGYGKTLIYALAGPSSYDKKRGYVAGLGVDRMITTKMGVSAKYYHGEYGHGKSLDYGLLSVFFNL